MSEVFIFFKLNHIPLRIIAATAISFGIALPSFALGLGEIRVRTLLGQTFLAHVDVIGSESENLSPTCIKGQVTTMENVLIANTNITVNQASGKKSLTFISKTHINEPAVKLVIQVKCESQLNREFSILLDPPNASFGSQTQFSTNLPVFGNQQIPDMVSNSPTGNSSSSSNNSKKSTLSSDVVPNPVQAKVKQEKAERKQQEKPSLAKKPTRDVLKLSDEVFVFPTSQGLRMSDVLSTQTGQQLVENMEELKQAQAKMAAILRDEIPSANNNEAQPIVSLSQLTELSQLRQETLALKKQAESDKLAIEELRKSETSIWVYVLAVLSLGLIGLIAYLFLYIRRNSVQENPMWWDDASHERVDPIDNIDEELAYERTSEKEKSQSVKLTPTDDGQLIQTNESNEFESEVDPDREVFEERRRKERPLTLEETNSSIFNFFSPRGSSVKVEEISDVTQEAEFWISMNDPNRAIEILKPHEKIEHPDSPLPWLFLLDLYKTVKNEESYNSLRDRFIVFFNAKVPDFEVEVDIENDRHLDDFPHVMNQVSQLWNDEKIIPYLESLLIDDREGKRIGFDLSVYRDILLLLSIAHELDRVKVVEGQLLGSLVKPKELSAKEIRDNEALEEADINIIEFESIDFPKLMPLKK